MTEVTVATRKWRLRGYAADDKSKIRHQSSCLGDRALNDALARLEQDKFIGRITAEYVG